MSNTHFKLHLKVYQSRTVMDVPESGFSPSEHSICRSNIYFIKFLLLNRFQFLMRKSIVFLCLKLLLIQTAHFLWISIKLVLYISMIYCTRYLWSRHVKTSPKIYPSENPMITSLNFFYIIRINKWIVLTEIDIMMNTQIYWVSSQW